MTYVHSKICDMRTDPSDEMILAATLASLNLTTPYRAARDAKELQGIGRAARRLAETRCNGIQRWNTKAGMMLASWTDADETKADRKAERMAAIAREILRVYGATLDSVSGDHPRGYCLKFHLANGESMGI